MLLRVGLLLVISLNLTWAMQCDGMAISAREAKRHAQIAFRGTVTEFRDSNKGDRLVVFRVTRVWKGRVTSDFEMPAIQSDTGRLGFYFGLLKIGAELLVFGSKLEPNDSYYMPVPHSTMLAKDVTDIRTLGVGRKPRSK